MEGTFGGRGDKVTSGVFLEVGSPIGAYTNVNGGDNLGKFIFDTSRVVPTGPENSPRTAAWRYWRRVA